MSLQNRVLFGLKVAFNFSDAESKTTALQNLGLDLRDLDVIRGISGSIDKVDLQNVSGLDTNLTRYLDRLSSDTSRYNALVNDLAGYNYATKGNLEAFGPVSGGAVRYKYIPNDGGINQNADDLKYGDISTSRVSSWSSATSDETNFTQAISYGGSVQVKGKLMIGQKQSFDPQVSECLLNVLDTPEPVRFPTEVPTDIIEVKFNNTSQFMYAMRGIPFIFTTAFKTIAMDFTFIPFTANGSAQVPIYTFKATDDSEPELVSKPTASGTLSRLRFSAQAYKERDIRVYYPPGNIRSIVGTGINLRYLPAAKFLNLETININNNLLGEMPDWRNINYIYFKGEVPGAGTPTPYQQSLSNGADPYNPPTQTLTNINIGRNSLYLSEDDELVKFGTNVVERFPSGLTSLTQNGCYRENTEFLTADQSLVIMSKNISANDFNFIKCDPTVTQTYPFDSIDTGETGVGTPSGLTVKGIFYDKFTLGDYKYVYIDEPEIKINGTNFTGSATEETTYPNLFGKMGVFQPLNLMTRTPGLRTFSIPRNGNRVIYSTSNTKRPNNTNPFTQIDGGGEQMPRVNIKNITSYNINNNGFSRAADEFINPQDYLEENENSALQTFNVYNNDNLNGVINFARMTNIRTINIGDTSLPIPLGLQDKGTLRTVSCAYSRFPTRTATATFDTATGEGNPSDVNNHFFTTKNPGNFGEYVFQNCSNLTSISMYSSRMDGFFPKLIGNSSMSSIDLRNTSIEGGRPFDASSNFGEHGRRYILWNDTFEDAQNITTIRIRSGVLGRNIGEYTPGPGGTAGTFTKASFQGATFNLPVLTTLEILCPQKRIRGEFFDPSQAPSLQTLISYSTGWGLDITGGTTCPSFAGNPSIRYVDLTDNQFSGNLSLSNLNSLKEFYMGSNVLDAITGWDVLPQLEYVTVSSNPTLGPDLPNFSSGSPKIRNLGFNNCNFTNYTQGTFATCTRIKVVDLSNNNFNSSSIDSILNDLIANYNAAPRSGVTINLKNNAPPTVEYVQVPTVNISMDTQQNITVNQSQFLDNGVIIDPDGIPDSGDEFFQPQPLDPEYIFGVGSNDPNHQIQITMRNDLVGTQSVGTQYETRVFLDGVQLNSEAIDINYSTNTITFLNNTPGNVTNYPLHNQVLSVQVWKTVYGFRTEIEGGVTLVTYLTARGWTVRTD